MKNEIYLDFCIWGFEDITHEDITKTFNIQPIKIYKKGEKINPNFSKVSSQNGWRIASGLNKYASFEDHLNVLLSTIESKFELFKSFCTKYYCEFSCALYIYYNNEESTPSVHLTSRYNKLIKELNLEFDIDIYCLPNK